MNHWQRQDLSDRIHKHGRYAPTPKAVAFTPLPSVINPKLKVKRKANQSKPKQEK